MDLLRLLNNGTCPDNRHIVREKTPEAEEVTHCVPIVQAALQLLFASKRFGDDHCCGKSQTQHQDYGKGYQEERHRLVQIESRAEMMANDRIER
jgi:hypothetical protein